MAAPLTKVPTNPASKVSTRESLNRTTTGLPSFPAQHLGHLEPAEQDALDSFKALITQKGFYRPANGQSPASHDDATLLRYLRARKFIPQDAYKQFEDTEIWRKENKLEQLYETIDVKDYEECRRLYPQWTGRRDKRGMPIYVFDVGHLNSKAITAYTKSTSASHSKMLRLFALYENLTRFIMPLCSSLSDRSNPETPITQSNNIVDIQGVGLRQFWNLKSHMQEASTLATAHYPETLDRIFIVGAPSFFPTVWGWVKRWFDPITVSKIFVLSANNVRPTLEKFIDPANIPKKYGGELPFEFGAMPIFDNTLNQRLEWAVPGINTFPQGPMIWERGEGQDQVAVAVGSLKGQQRRDPVATLHARGIEKINNGYA